MLLQCESAVYLACVSEWCGRCHHVRMSSRRLPLQTGNYYARRRMTLLFTMLDYLGVAGERFRVEWVSPPPRAHVLHRL